MAIKPPVDPKALLINKRALQQTMDELNKRMGFVRDPKATAEQTRALILAEGIRPEDNAFSREIIRMRCEENAE